MRQLIEDLISAMEYHVEQTRPVHSTTVALQAARGALKAMPAPVQEPVAWQYRDANDDGTWSAWLGCDKRLTASTWREVRPLYTTPPAAQRQWVGLTLTERNQLCRDLAASTHQVRAIEAKLKEKNA